jgi:hypothetical protein
MGVMADPTSTVEPWELYPMPPDQKAAIRRYIQRVAEKAVAEERARIKELICLPALQALRAIPDGRIQKGCVVMDGKQVRERLRQAYLAIDAEPVLGEDAEGDQS